MPKRKIDVTVDNVNGVQEYYVVFEKSRLVPINNGVGWVFAEEGHTYEFLFLFSGNSGGSMDIKLSRGSAVLDERKPTKIPPSSSTSYDRLFATI